jgi:hypothetical protein
MTIKKLVFLFIACNFTITAFAQKLTQKDIQGTWKLAGFSVEGIYLDVAKEDVTFSKELEAKYPEVAREQIKLGMLENIEGFQSARTYIEGNNIRQTMGGEEDKGTFTITTKGADQFIAISNPEGATDEVKSFFKDKQLHMIQKDEEQEVEFIYIKI